MYNEGSITLGNVPPSEYVDIGLAHGANRGEAGLAADLLNKITGVNGYNLDNLTDAGPGNTALGLEWTCSIAGNGSLILGENLNISGVGTITPAPEPAVWSLGALGLAACFARRGVRVLRPS